MNLKSFGSHFLNPKVKINILTDMAGSWDNSVAVERSSQKMKAEVRLICSIACQTQSETF